MGKFVNYFVLFILIVLNTFEVYCETADFQKIWLEHNIMHNSQKCLAIKVEVVVSYLNGENIEFVAFVDTPKGVGHKDKNNNYRNQEGNVCVSSTDKSIYDHCRWEAYTLYLPNDEIHPLPGTHTYFVRVFAFHKGSPIGHSEFVSFDMTGQVETATVQGEVCSNCNGTGKVLCGFCKGKGHFVYQHFSSYPPFSYLKDDVCHHCNQTGKIICTWCNGTGRKSQSADSGNFYGGGNSSTFYENSSSGNSSSNSNVYTKCNSCGGTGVCPRCHGSKGTWEDTGYYTGSNTKSWINCPACNGSGKCSICFGRGKL